MEYFFDTKFEIGDRVYYNLPEAPIGLVTAIGYSVVTGKITYYVTFEPQSGEVSCFDYELNKTKVII